MLAAVQSDRRGVELINFGGAKRDMLCFVLVMPGSSSEDTSQEGVDDVMADSGEEENREVAPTPPRDIGDLSKEELEMRVGNSTDFMYLCMFISEFGRGLKVVVVVVGVGDDVGFWVEFSVFC